MLLKDGKKINVSKEFTNSFVKPITFQLCDNQGGINIATHKLQFPISRGILPFYTIREKIQGGGSTTVELRYATSQRKGENDEYQYDPPTIDFYKGQLILSPDNKTHLDLLYILRNHPNNQGSPESEGKPIFYEVDPEKISMDDVSKRTARHEAEDKILKDWDKDQLKEIAYAFGDLTANDKSKAQLQSYLLKLVDIDPVGFHKQATSEDLALRANISKGISLKVIVEKEGIWFWGVDKDREDKSQAEICRIRSGEDPKTRLMIFFNRSIKSENLDYFLERLEAAIAPIEAEKVK